MKKTVLILVIVLMFTLMLASPVFATNPTYSQGKWTNWDNSDLLNSKYDLVEGLWLGTINQPVKPGQAQKAYFEGTFDGIPGTCVFNVRTFNVTGGMSGAVIKCDGELSGLRATFRGTFESPDPFWGYFKSWHHFEGNP